MGKKSRCPKAGKKGKGGGAGGGGRGGAGGKRGAPAIATYAPDTSDFGDAPSPEAVAAFWEWFKDNERDLRDVFNGGVLQSFREELKTVGSPYCLHYDIGSPEGFMTGDRDVTDEPHHLTISAGGKKEAFNTVISLVGAAPTDLEGWRFTALRRRQEDVGECSAFFRGRSYPHSNIRYMLAKDDRVDKIGIWLYLRGFRGDIERLPEEEQTYFNEVGYMALDAALGEYDVEVHIGEVRFFSSLDAHLHALEYGGDVGPLSRLPHDFDGWLSEKIGRKPKGGWMELAGLSDKLDVVGSATAGSPTSVADVAK